MTKKNENGEFSSIKEENRTNFIPASSMDTLDSTLIVDQTTNDSTSVLADHQSLKERIMASIMNIPDDGEDMHGDGDKDICRVCRLSGDDTLYHPCLCTGSIKYVHQDCLLQWLKYSKKDVCELCNHKFSFRPLYREDMPERLPIWDLMRGVFLIMARFMRLTLTYTLVATCWLGLVPLMAARTHRLVFSGLISSFFSSRILQLFSTDNVAIDIARGSLVVTLFLCTFISLVWLREQIMIGGPGHILHIPEEQPANNETDAAAQIPVDTEATDNQPSMQIQSSNEDQASIPEQPQQSITTPTPSFGLDPLSQSPSTSSAVPALPLTQPEQTSTSSDSEQQQSPLSRKPLEHFQPIQRAFMTDQPAQQPQQQPPNIENEQQPQAQAAFAADLIDQQRFVDELTWQRLLGLDGSFAFIEHVFWTISLNIVFNVIFLYLPAQIGASILTLCGFGPGKIGYFELPISVMAGLLVILIHGILIHRIARIFRLKSLYTTAGMICLMLKVFLLVITELVFFPILCGWWLDLCSLPLTGVTLDDRLRNFRQYPSSSMFLHWLAGMVYVFYSASFILILRELLRPGVLWFIRNLHDPDFNPIQEMIEQPVTHHIRRLIASMTLFFSIIMLAVYFPLRIIKWLHPTTLPYVFTGSADTPLVEYSFELVLLQVIMPTILEYSKAFSLLKRTVRLWCRIVGGWLQLDSYLLPAEKDRQDVDQREQQRQRARERLLRGNQEEQIGLLEALEAIEDDTTDEEGGIEQQNGDTSSAESEDDNAGNENEEAVANGQNETLQPSISNNNNNQNDLGLGSELEMEITNGSEPLKLNDQEEINNQNPQEQPLRNGTEAAAIVPDMPAVEVPANMENAGHLPAQDALQQRLQEQREQRNLGAQHHALLRFRDVTTSEDYVRPNYFPLRIALLLFFVCLTAEALALIFFFVPVTIGRILLSWLALTNQPVHDLYTVAAGLYTCWFSARMAMISREWAQKGWTYVKKLFSSFAWLMMRIVAAAIPLLVVIPFMMGFYFQMLVISPLRVAIFQSPLFFPWKEWAMGVVHFKILCASVLMGPDWWMKTAFEQIYADGIWNFRLRDLYLNLVLPLINALAFLIAFPYALSKFLLLFVEATREDQIIFTRYSYPILLCTICTVAFLIWQWQKLKKLAQNIRNDKYLIGTQLVNFYRDNTPAIGHLTGSISAKMTGAGTSATDQAEGQPSSALQQLSQEALQPEEEQGVVGVDEILRVANVHE